MYMYILKMLYTNKLYLAVRLFKKCDKQTKFPAQGHFKEFLHWMQEKTSQQIFLR